MGQLRRKKGPFFLVYPPPDALKYFSQAVHIHEILQKKLPDTESLAADTYRSHILPFRFASALDEEQYPFWRQALLFAISKGSTHDRFLTDLFAREPELRRQYESLLWYRSPVEVPGLPIKIPRRWISFYMPIVLGLIAWWANRLKATGDRLLAQIVGATTEPQKRERLRALLLADGVALLYDGAFVHRVNIIGKALWRALMWLMPPLLFLTPIVGTISPYFYVTSQDYAAFAPGYSLPISVLVVAYFALSLAGVAWRARHTLGSLALTLKGWMLRCLRNIS